MSDEEEMNISPDIKAMTTLEIVDRLAFTQQEYGKYYGWKEAARHLRDMAGVSYAEGRDEKAKIYRDCAEVLDGEMRSVYEKWANRFKAVTEAYFAEIEIRQKQETARILRELPNQSVTVGGGE